MRGGICDVRVCIVSIEHLLSFSTRVPMSPPMTANHRRTLTCIFKFQLYVENLDQFDVDGIRTNNLLINNQYYHYDSTVPCKFEST